MSKVNIMLFYLTFLIIPTVTGTRYDSQSDVTFVTALYDIGRGDWKVWTRPFNTYLKYFENLLQCQIHIIIFCEKETAKYVKEYRKSIRDKTLVNVVQFEKLEMYRYRQHIQNVMETDEFRANNSMLDRPEGFSADYLILMNNKVSFLKKAMMANPFNSSHFYWIDAGYGHGSAFAGSNVVSKVESLAKTQGKIRYIALSDPALYTHIQDMHKMLISPAFSGGFFGGDIKALRELYSLYLKTFRLLLTENIVDDDQNVALLCYYECPRLFYYKIGKWFDAFNIEW